MVTEVGVGHLIHAGDVTLRQRDGVMLDVVTDASVWRLFDAVAKRLWRHDLIKHMMQRTIDTCKSTKPASNAKFM